MDEVDITVVKDRLSRVMQDYRVASFAVRSATPPAAWPTIRAMEEMFETVCDLAVALAATPFEP